MAFVYMFFAHVFIISLSTQSVGELDPPEIKDYEKLTATKTLFAELKKGEDSAKEKGWLSTKDVRTMVGL